MEASPEVQGWAEAVLRKVMAGESVSSAQLQLAMQLQAQGFEERKLARQEVLEERRMRRAELRSSGAPAVQTAAAGSPTSAAPEHAPATVSAAKSKTHQCACHETFLGDGILGLERNSNCVEARRFHHQVTDDLSGGYRSMERAFILHENPNLPG